MPQGVALHELVWRDGRAVDYRFLEVNPAFEMHTGLRARVVLGRLASEAYGSSPPPHLETFAAAVASGIAREDGSFFAAIGRYLNVTALPLSDGRFAVVVTDTTARHRQEEALKRSEADLARSQRVARLGSYFLDVRTGIWDCTPVLDEIFGTQKKAQRGLADWIEILHPEDRDAMARYFAEEVIKQGKPFDREYRIARKSDGRTVIVHGRGELEKEADGTVISMFGTIQDVTDRRQLESKVLQAQKLESLGLLAGGIAHDFNNLLTIILSNVTLASADLSPDSPAGTHLLDIELAARRAADLARQMLAYSGRGRFVVQPLSLNDLVREMGDLLAVSINKKVTVSYHLGSDLPAVSGDASQLQQVVMNLITNANEAIGDREGTIALGTGLVETDLEIDAVPGGSERLKPGRYVFLEVRDTGAGMSAETLARIFDPFFTTKFTGRGLGLAAVQGIVRGHRGGLSLASQLGRGTAFRVLLPAVTAPARAIGPDQRGTVGWKGQGLVLLVDDEAQVRDVARRMLERHGFQVVTAGDGLEALEMFRRHRADVRLALVDLTMPRMDGESCFRELRRLSPTLKVLLVSGYSEQEVAGRFAGDNPAGFVQKPFTAATLIPYVRAALGE
ncbi:MAG TPA: response regulator [Polyangia bacterium]|nr:response regulator [Polyangia bacterium]